MTPEKRAGLGLKESNIWGKDGTLTLTQTCAHLAPALDINLAVRENTTKQYAVLANDWKTLPQMQLLQRIAPFSYHEDNLRHVKDWLRLTELQTDDGKLIGRCAISTRHRGKAAIGVTKGILAGYIEGMTGIILSKPQTDLSRQTALPDITRRNLQFWAEQQKDILCSLDALDMARSEVLAEYGASYNQLLIGTLGGEAISQLDFIKRLEAMKQFVVHDGEVEHDGDDDVKASEFSEFVAIPLLLELNVGGFFSTKPSWLKEIPDAGVDDDSWSILEAFRAALNEAWGDNDCWREAHGSVPVGYVEGTAIERFCDVYTRHANDEE